MSPRRPERAGAPSPWSVLLQRPRRARTGQVLLAAAAAATACAVLDLGAWRAATVGVALAVLGLAAVALPRPAPLAWPAARAASGGAGRAEVLHLATSLRAGHGRVGQAALARVQRLGRRRLHEVGLELGSAADRAAIEQLVGRRATEVLTARADPLPPVEAVAACVDRIERLRAHPGEEDP